MFFFLVSAFAVSSEFGARAYPPRRSSSIAYSPFVQELEYREFHIAFVAFYDRFTQMLCVCVIYCFTCVQPVVSIIFILFLFLLFAVWQASLSFLGHFTTQLGGNHLKYLVSLKLND